MGNKAFEDKGIVLILEDNPQYGRALQNEVLGHVESRGYDVMLATTPAEAMDIIRSERVVAAIVDDVMEEVKDPNGLETLVHEETVRMSTGYDFMTQAHNLKPDARYILHTGQTGRTDTVIKLANSQVGKYVTKSEGNSQLFEVLDEELRRYGMYQGHRTGQGKGRFPLITGGLGFVGTQYVTELLRQDPAIEQAFLLIRPKTEKKGGEVTVVETAQERALKALPEWTHDRITVVSGDLGVSPYFGLGKEDLSKVMDYVDSIEWIAANLEFLDSPANMAQLINTNVTGVANALTLAKMLGRPLEGFNMVGTIFIHGTQADGKFHEDYFDHGTIPMRHTNQYELTKRMALDLLRSSGYTWRSFNQGITMAEPGAENLSFDTAYGVAHLMKGFADKYWKENSDKDSLHIRIQGNPSSKHPFIFRSDLVRTMVALRDSDSVNHVYNVATEENIPLTYLFDSICKCLTTDGRTVTYEFVDKLPPKSELNRAEVLFENLVTPRYGIYLNKSAPDFDRTNMTDALGGSFVSTLTQFDRQTMDFAIGDFFQRAHGLQLDWMRDAPQSLK